MYKCKTVKLAITGVITRVYGRADYAGIDVFSVTIHSISFNVDKVISKKGFKDFHYIEVGDTISKKANNDTVTIKTKDSICIVRLVCN